MKQNQRKHLRMPLFHKNKNYWLLLNRSFFSDHSRNKIPLYFARNEK